VPRVRAYSARRMRSQMLPGGLLEERAAKRSARDWIVDVTMFLLAIVIGFVALGETEAVHPSDEWVFIDLVVGAALLVPLWWRRKYPFAVALITLIPGAVSAFAAGPGLVAMFNVALRGSRRQIITIAIGSVIVGTIVSQLYPDDELPDLFEFVLAVLITAVVIGWGLFARTQRDLLRSSHERARRLEAEQRARIEQAREAERRRIAGEMHDVLAHRLSLLSVHAGALEFNTDASPDEIAKAAGVIRETAHAALGDLREVIGVLRSHSDGPPQPTLGDIPALIEESRAAGMNVRATITAERADDLLGRTAYRIVQEGLTNARRHAPSAAVEVTVAEDDGLLVEVVSRRPARPTARTEGGTGLIGLAERVALVGGELSHGPDPRGNFVLRAKLPL
jgi:signal transduction histidine kinase